MILRVLILAALIALSGCGGSKPATPAAPPIPPATLDKVMNLQAVGARIQPPMRWTLDQVPNDPNAFIRGPKEKGYSPLVIVSMEEAPGDLEAYVKEQKARVASQDKTVKWLAEAPATLDGRPATRLEYDFEDNAEPPAIGKVRVHGLQYIVEDKPKFYRVSCYVIADAFDRYLERFEACAKTFARGAAEEKK
jgi:hypothetical protein